VDTAIRFDLQEENLLLIGRRSIGKRWTTYGMSHRPGYEIEKEVYFVAQSNVLDSNKFLRFRGLSRFYEAKPDDLTYFHIFSTNQILVSHVSASGESSLEKIFWMTTNRSSKLSVSNSGGGLNSQTFIFNRSGSNAVVNARGFKMYDVVTMTEMTNALAHAFSTASTLSNRFSKLKLSDDLQFLFAWIESQNHEILIFRRDGTYITHIPDGINIPEDMESISNEVKWVSSNGSIRVGSLGNDEQTAIQGRGEISWNYSSKAILVVPHQFTISEKQFFETPLKIWKYEAGIVKEVRGSFEEFKTALSRLISEP
jgi:hypothetical protein